MKSIEITILTARLADYSMIQNMARFYVYDRTDLMGWECPENGLFECIDFKHYFTDPDKKAFLIRVKNEIAGFVLLDKMELLEPVDWNMGEFFILKKFQNKKIGSKVAKEIFKNCPGRWTVSVMPENVRALNFWQKIIEQVCKGAQTEVFKTSEELKSLSNPDPYPMKIFSFIIVA